MSEREDIVRRIVRQELEAALAPFRELLAKLTAGDSLSVIADDDRPIFIGEDRPRD